MKGTQSSRRLVPYFRPDDVAKKVHALEYEHFPQIIEQVLLII
jgi:phosphoribosylglycinamide formyltransferase-1